LPIRYPMLLEDEPKLARCCTQPDQRRWNIAGDAVDQ